MGEKGLQLLRGRRDGRVLSKKGIFSFWYNQQEMEKQTELDSRNCIEVKGLNGLSSSYIKRFFGHVGQVEEIKKLDGTVIVRFKQHGSAKKAHRYNGRIIDREPLKIKNLFSQIPAEDTSETHKPRPFSKAALKFNYDKYHDKTKYGPLDVPFHWAQSLKVIDILAESKARWLMHEIFVLQFSHALHQIYFNQNQISSFYEVKLKQFLINHRNLMQNVESEKNNLQKFQLTIKIPNDLNYEGNFLYIEHDTERKFREMLKNFKQYGIGNRVLHLYAIFARYGLKQIEPSIVVSPSQSPEDEKDSRKIQIEKKTDYHLQLSVQEWQKEKQRSEYRSVDETHPSKAIQIFSDSIFHKSPFTKNIYDFFRDSFDGTMNNNCAADIFHEFSPYFSPNYLLIRHISGKKTLYIRLDFELRILNSVGEILQLSDYRQVFVYQEYQGQHGLIQAESVKLLKHNLILPSFENPEKAVYLVENYVKYYCIFDKPESSESDQTLGGPLLTIFFIAKNPSQEVMKKIESICGLINGNLNINRIRYEIYTVCVHNNDKFEQLKCQNYIEAYVDQLKGELTHQLAKFHAHQLVQKSPEKFKQILQPSQFVERMLWGLYLQKSKRRAKNKIMSELMTIRK